MAVQSSIIVEGAPQPYKLIVEPWADEHTINPDDHCSVVAIHPKSRAPFQVERHESAFIIWVNIGDATYQFWRNGNLEFTNPVPTPGPLGELERFK